MCCHRYELKPNGVDVSIVEPGAFPTPGMRDIRVDRFGAENVRELNDAHAKVQRNLLSEMGLGALTD